MASVVEVNQLHPLRINPAEHPFKEIRTSVLLEPHNDGSRQIVRWPPRLNVDLDTALELIKTRRRHLEAITQISNVAVPPMQEFIGNVPTPSYTPHELQILAKKIGIFTVVPYYEDLRPITRAAQAQTIASMLHGYNEWLNDNKEPLYMYDIYTLRQYGITDETVTLIDVDPYFSPRFNRDGELSLAHLYTRDKIDELATYLY